MNLFKLLLQRSRLLLVIAVVAGIVNGAAATLAITLVVAALQDGPARDALMWPFFGVCALVLASGFLSQALTFRLSHDAFLSIRLDLVGKVLATPLRRLEALGAGRLMGMLSDDVMRVFQAIQEIPNLLGNLATTATALVYLVWLSRGMIGFLIPLIGITAVINVVVDRAAAARLRQARTDQDDLFGKLRGLTEGTKELKLNAARRARFGRAFEVTARSMRRSNLVSSLIYAAGGGGALGLYYAALGAMVFIPAMLGALDLGGRAGCAMILVYLGQPIGTILNFLPRFRAASIGLHEIAALGASLDRDAEAAASVVPAAELHAALELSGVTHAYHREGEGGTFTVGPIDLTIRRGELVFVIGGNGSGKSTLAKLLTGLYAPQAGEVRLDGRAIDASSQAWYREHFSAVFSDYHLFAELEVASPAMDAEAQGYLAELQLQHKVRIDGGVFSTTELSQGQRKRLALLSAYLEDRPIYLFDEWASDQDPAFKDIFYRQLLPALQRRGKTVIVISHDERYFDVAHRVLKLEDGKLVHSTGARAPRSSPRQREAT